MDEHDSRRHQPGSGEPPNPSEGHILPGILLQEAIEANEWHHLHDRHYQIITLIGYVYTISYTYIVYDIVFDIDKNHRNRIC